MTIIILLFILLILASIGKLFSNKWSINEYSEASKILTEILEDCNRNSSLPHNGFGKFKILGNSEFDINYSDDEYTQSNLYNKYQLKIGEYYLKLISYSNTSKSVSVDNYEIKSVFMIAMPNTFYSINDIVDLDLSNYKVTEKIYSGYYTSGQVQRWLLKK